MSENSERTTSFAKTVDLPGHDQTALDRVEPLTKTFQNAQDGQQQGQSRSPNQENVVAQGHGSDMVKNTRPQPELTPEGTVRNVVDGALHLNAMTKEQGQAQERLKDAIGRMELVKAIQQGKQLPGQEQRQTKPIDDEKLAQAIALKSDVTAYVSQQLDARQSHGRSRGV